MTPVDLLLWTLAILASAPLLLIASGFIAAAIAMLREAWRL